MESLAQKIVSKKFDPEYDILETIEKGRWNNAGPVMLPLTNKDFTELCGYISSSYTAK